MKTLSQKRPAFSVCEDFWRKSLHLTWYCSNTLCAMCYGPNLSLFKQCVSTVSYCIIYIFNILEHANLTDTISLVSVNTSHLPPYLTLVISSVPSVYNSSFISSLFVADADKRQLESLTILATSEFAYAKRRAKKRAKRSA